MEPLEEHQLELNYRYNQSGIEVQLVYDRLLQMAYTRVHDHVTNEEFISLAPAPLSASESFNRPYRHRITMPVLSKTVELVEVEDGKGDE